MNQIILSCVIVLMTLSAAHAQWGDVLNNLKSNPALANQSKMQEVIGKAQALATAFAQMPANSGKLDYIKAALPLLTQAQTASAQPNQTSKIGGLLDQAKAMMSQQWSTKPLTTHQVNEVKTQGQKVADALKAIITNEANAMKATLMK